MKKLLTLLITVILAVSCCFSLTACKKNEKVVALICLHGDDSSYDKNFIDSFKAACEAKGLNDSQYTIVTGVPEEGDDCYEKAAGFADAGYKAVFADSFGHEANMIKAAKAFPNVQFCHATGTQTSLLLDDDASNDVPANFHNAFASIYEGRYLAGVAAGLKLLEMYDDNNDGVITDDQAKVGYVGAHPYAEVISGFTSWYLGIKSIVPNVTMQVRYTYSWFTINGEKASALALINDGCKLISAHADSTGVPTACKEKGVPNVYYNGTTTEDTFVIASKINWQPYFEAVIDNALNGTALAKDYCGTISTGSVVVTETGKAAAAGTAEKLAEVKAKLLNGTLNVFDCSTFTVNNAKAYLEIEKDYDEQNKKHSNDYYKAFGITMDADGHLTAYLADVIDDGTFVGETNVVKDGVFKESDKRSAPYFDLIIDGITIGANVEYED